MCYEVYISTDSPEDLTQRSSELVRFKLATVLDDDTGLQILEFPHRWYVGSKSECSCTFRHLYSIELGFGEPVEWYPEEQEDIDATQDLYGTLASLLSSGYRVDLLDRWMDAQAEDIMTVDVSFAEVSENAFRLFENHKFRLKGRAS